jgi:hypothetical protein
MELDEMEMDVSFGEDSKEKRRDVSQAEDEDDVSTHFIL